MGLRRTSYFIIFLKKRRKCDSIFEVQHIKRTKQKKQTCSHKNVKCLMWFSFIEAENVLKEETKDKNCKPNNNVK